MNLSFSFPNAEVLILQAFLSKDTKKRHGIKDCYYASRRP